MHSIFDLYCAWIEFSASICTGNPFMADDINAAAMLERSPHL